MDMPTRLIRTSFWQGEEASHFEVEPIGLIQEIPASVEKRDFAEAEFVIRNEIEIDAGMGKRR